MSDVSTRTRRSRAPRLRVGPREGGLHLKDSVLSLDVYGTAKLSFVSSAKTTLKTLDAHRVIATEETIHIIEALRKKKPNALTCQYHRPFSIGDLRLELLPSGSLVGSAMLRVETQGRTLLYAPALQTAPVPHVRPLHLKRAHILLLGTHHANPHHTLPDRTQERKRLAAALTDSTRRVKIFCTSIGTAQEVTELATTQQLTVAVHPTVAAVNRIYQNFAIGLGKYRVFNRKRDNWQVAILPCSLANCPRTRRIDALTFYLHDTYPPPPIIAPPDNYFYLSRTCSGVELRQVIARVRPREIFTFGDHAKAYCAALRPFCAHVRPLYAGNQPTLF